MDNNPEAQQQRALLTLLTPILDGEWPPGHRIPSERALARLCQVGVSTAARALHLLRHYGFIAGRRGAASRVASREALRHAKRAWKAAEQARDINRQT